MKKFVSILLMLGMLAGLMVPAVISASAEAQPSGTVLTFDDWKNPFAYPADKFTATATAVTSINDNPVAVIYPLKGGDPAWTHVLMPFTFERQKTYVISYDVAVTEQLGKDALTDAVLNVVVCNSVYSSENVSSNPFKKIQKVVTYEQGSSSTVTAGKWNHVTATVSIPDSSGMWWEPDSIGFWEDNGSQQSASCFAIDNLVIMEQSEFNSVYPSGVPARTDDPSVGYDKIVALYNTTRYLGLRSIVETSNKATVPFGTDNVLKWKRTSAAEANLFTPFFFQKDKSYRVGFDVSAAMDTTLYLAASQTKAAADSNAALQRFQMADGATSVALQKNTWTHVEMTLTPTVAAKYFVLTTEEYAKGNIMFDNFALALTDVYPAEMPLRTEDPDLVLRLDFEDEERYFFNALNSSRIALSTETVKKGDATTKALKWTALTGGKAYNKIIAPYAFAKETTYVVSFDVMAFEQYGGGELKDTKLAIYSVYKDFTKFENTDLSKSYETVAVKAGEWTHVSVTFKVPSIGDGSNDTMNYLGLCEFTENENNASFYIDNLTVAPKTADCTADTHVEGVWTVTKNATCTEAGSKDLKCAICGETIRTEAIASGAGAHTPGEWTVDQEATCTEEGKKHTECTVCGTTMEEKIAATGHTTGDWVIDKEANCTEAGERHKVCSVCNEKVDQQSIPAAGHTPGRWEIVTPASEGVAGRRHKLCAVCGAELEAEELPALPTATDEPTEPVTSGENGSGSGKGCSSAVSAGFLALIAVCSLAGFAIVKKKSHS